MGILTTILCKRNAALGLGYKLVKMALQLRRAASPLAAAEKAILLLAEGHVAAVLSWHAFKIVKGRVDVGRVTSQTMDVISGYDADPSVPLDLPTLDEVMGQLEAVPGDEHDAMVRAGLVFLRESMIRVAAGDVGMEEKFVDKPTGRFKTRACLSAFYATDTAPRLAKAVGALPAWEHVLCREARAELRPLVEDAWVDVRVQLRNDVIDLVLL